VPAREAEGAAARPVEQPVRNHGHMTTRSSLRSGLAIQARSAFKGWPTFAGQPSGPAIRSSFGFKAGPPSLGAECKRQATVDTILRLQSRAKDGGPDQRQLEPHRDLPATAGRLASSDISANVRPSEPPVAAEEVKLSATISGLSRYHKAHSLGSSAILRFCLEIGR
jgi:hypothetical protein